MTEIQIKETQRKCPSCNVEMYYIEKGVKEKDQKRFKWERYYSIWGGELSLNYAPHDLENCKIEQKEIKKTDGINYKWVEIIPKEETCLNCKYNEFSDGCFYCNNSKNDNTKYSGWHAERDEVIGDGYFYLPVCDNWEG